MLALVLALAACAGETPVPTAPVPPTITPEPWDATVSALATGLRELPHLKSQVMETLPGGTKVDLLAITEDKEWVQATAHLGEDSAIKGWLQVDKLKLNVSLDDLEVDTETAFVPPPTRTPEPTEIPLEEQYIAHFAAKGFEIHEVPGQYMFPAGRGWIVVAVIEEGPMFGHASRTDWTEEERTLIFDHLQEAAAFLDPNEGWITVLGAIDAMSKGIPEGFAHTSSGREVLFRQTFLDDGTVIVTFTFMNDTFEHVDRAANPLMNPANEHFYEAVAVSGGIDWFDARVAAELRTFEGIHGHLATITSTQEDTFIATNFPEAFPVVPSTRLPGCEGPTTVENTCGFPYWFGGFQPPGSPDEPEGDWEWVTGEPFDYTNWHPDEPNDFQGREEDCLHPHPDGSLAWNDSSCDDRRVGGYVVEYDSKPLNAELSPLGGGGKIAFSSNRGGDFEIYLMNPDGTNQVRLTNQSTNDYSPEFSPDGDMLLFFASDAESDPPSGEFQFLGIDGTHMGTFVELGFGPSSWSPDGKTIALTIGTGEGNMEILIGEIGGTSRLLTSNPAPDHSPAWSPDGKTLAFVSHRTVSRRSTSWMQAATTSEGSPNPIRWSLSPHGPRMGQRSHLYLVTTSTLRSTS